MGIDLFSACDPKINESDLFKVEIDKEFAKRFEHNKQREALHRLEELKKRGLAGESEDSEDPSDESSEDDADRSAASGKKELQFYDALVRVKKKDPVMQQKDAKLFSSSSEDEEEEEKKPNDLKKKKPLYLKDLMARQLMEEGPEFDGEPLKENPLVYNREQAEGIKALLEAEKEAFDANGDDDIIKLKEKSSTEDEDENDGEIKKRLDEYFGNDGNLSEGDMFLKNYLINRMWVDKEKDKRYSWDEIRVSEDEDELDRQDKYEAEYNFRHEEGQHDRVLGHSRIVEGSVRKKSNSRKEQRKSKGARLIQAEFERREELKHLKNLKKKEIQEKLERIRETAGMGEDAFCNVDIGHLEEEFDPEEYDKTMRELFGVEYYNAEDVDPGFGSETGGDLEKPDFNKEDKLLGLPKDWDSVDTMEGFETLRKVMLVKNDAEKEPSNEEGRRKKKRKISLREKLELDKELEDYYKLDYEGTVGDLKTRFKYRVVPANSYGLHAEEILMANDNDLNQYVSLKRLAPYREKEWKVTYHQKLKKHMILQGKQDGKASIRKHLTGGFINVRNADKETETSEDANVLSKRSRKRHKHALLKLSKSRLIAYGKIPSNSRKKH